MKQKRNLISKRIGIGDHMPANKFTKIIFKDAPEFADTVNNNGDKRKCIKNQYVSDEWLRAWIKCDVNKLMGKTNAFYVYNVDYDDVMKPCKKYLNDEKTLYEYANGVMYFDFDNIGVDTVETVRQCFIELCEDEKNKYFQWFETSWSGNGCHIRLNFELKLHNKAEWLYLYFYHLDVLMKQIKKHVDTTSWCKNNTIDWSCANIMRGFAIPYNANGVTYNEKHNSEIDFYDTIEDIQYDVNFCIGIWEPELSDKFLKLIDKRRPQQKKIVSKYYVKSVSDENVTPQPGEKFDYNWRLKCVTTLMNIYNGDKDKVREVCKYIYYYIKPYKNHTYNEMLNNELEEKIFRNGNMTMNASNEIIDDLRTYFGFEFNVTNKINNRLYIPELYKNIE